MFIRFKVIKPLFSTYCTVLLLLYVPPFWNESIFTKLIVLRSEAWSDWPAIQCIVIGRIPQAWDKNIMPLTVLWCRVSAQAFVESSGDIITVYNDLYCLFTRCIAIAISAFVIGEKTNNKQYSTLLKTRVWIVRSRNALTGCESEASDCTCKVGIAPLYRNSLCASQHCSLPFQVQEIALRKMRCTVHTL